MGVKSTIAVVTASVAHSTAAQALGRNPSSMHAQAGAQLTDTINLLTQIIKDLSKASPFSVSGATLANAGGSYAVNEVLNLGNGVQITVNTVTSGAIATFTVTTAGSLAGAVPPPNPIAQVSTSGNGRQATFNLTWTSADANATTYLNAITSLS
jgi:hypothetical protein